MDLTSDQTQEKKKLVNFKIDQRRLFMKNRKKQRNKQKDRSQNPFCTTFKNRLQDFCLVGHTSRNAEQNYFKTLLKKIHFPWQPLQDVATFSLNAIRSDG